MKTKTAIFLAIVAMHGAIAANASECTTADCGTQIVYDGGFPAWDDDPAWNNVPAWDMGPMPAVNPVVKKKRAPEMVPAKLLSIKPVPTDTRPALWDGTDGNFKSKNYDKTVDWRDGVPIWDDSIADYRATDFSDWFLAPTPEIYLRETYGTPPNQIAATDETDLLSLYNRNMADAAATRARVEELLAPRRPTDNLWINGPATQPVAHAAPTADAPCNTTDTTPAAESHYVPRAEYTAQDMRRAVVTTFGDGCPFETQTECEIWRRKPIIRETVSPRSPNILPDRMDAFIAAARCDADIDASADVAAPLLARYKMLMRSANACCTDGMVYALRTSGASNALIYKFMADDANFYGFGSRCLMMSDGDLDRDYPNTATAAVAADVRNGCLCRGRQWFNAMLAPFVTAYNAAPDFANAKFYYTYTDGLGRKITTSINNDVQNVLHQLAMCP